MRATIGLLGLLACGGGAKEAPEAGTGPSATPPTGSTSGPTTSTPPAPTTSTPPLTDTATDTPTFHYDSSDTGATGDRTLCLDATLPPVTVPDVVATDVLSGCMAGRQRVELAASRTPVGHAVGPWEPGSAACSSDTLAWSVASDPYATVPGELTFQHWDLASGVLVASVLEGLRPPEDQVLNVASAGICDPAAAFSVVSACDGQAYRPRGVSTVSGLAYIASDPAQVELRLDWGTEVDELWYWMLLPHEGLALGPWPAEADGADWVGRLAFGDLGITQSDEGVLWGAVGCTAGVPSRARVF